MEGFLRALPNTFIPLFVAIDIFWLLPIFVSFTQGLEPKKLRGIISQSVITALLVSLVFTAVGEAVFRLVGITVDDFKVAGGVLLLALAMLDLMSIGSKTAVSTDTAGVVPIGVPLIVGPAVLTTILVLVNHFGVAPTVASLVLNLLIVWAAFRWAGRLLGFLGANSVTALSKIMAILLASIAVMMIRLGILGIIGRA